MLRIGGIVDGARQEPMSMKLRSSMSERTRPKGIHRTVFADHTGETARLTAGLQRRKAHKVQAPGST